LLLTAVSPPATQRWATTALATTLGIAFLLVLPFKDRQWPPSGAFIPIIDSILFLNSLITAVLLYARFSLAHRRAVLALAVGYLFTALLVIPHLLTFPGALAPMGLLGAGVQSAVWLYIFGHLGLPTAVMAYALLKDTQATTARSREAPDMTIPVSIAAVGALVAVLTWLVTAHERSLPTMMLDWTHASYAWQHAGAPALLIVSAGAIAVLWRRRSSVLDVWLLLVLWAWFIETMLLSMTTARFSLVWYAGRVFGVLASSFVLLALLYESTMLYARIALAAATRDGERDRQRLTLQVVASSIAHELSQPLSAIVANSDAGLQLLDRSPADLVEARAALRDIASEGRRVSELIKSIRAALTGAAQPMAWVDLGLLIRETLTVLRSELQADQVTVQLEITSGVPPVRGNKGELLQVLVNLITNALDAMAEVSDRPRVLSIRFAPCAPAGVSVAVEDTGVGVDAQQAERIFDPFFTAKPHGTGLGLAICRSIIEAHGGRISVSGGRQHGSIFQIFLPMPRN
jgi:signal transduction histidine kinase